MIFLVPVAKYCVSKSVLFWLVEHLTWELNISNVGIFQGLTSWKFMANDSPLHRFWMQIARVKRWNLDTRQLQWEVVVIVVAMGDDWGMSWVLGHFFSSTTTKSIWDGNQNGSDLFRGCFRWVDVLSKKNGLILSMLQKSQGCSKTPGGIWMSRAWNYLEILMMVQKFQNNHLGWW